MVGEQMVGWIERDVRAGEWDGGWINGQVGGQIDQGMDHDWMDG